MSARDAARPAASRVPAGLTVGLSGAHGHAAAAAASRSGLFGVCPQERLTRNRGAGFNASGLPDEAVDAVLERAPAGSEIARYLLAGPPPPSRSRVPLESIDQHVAHAATAYLTSPFTDATIVICDRSEPRLSVWHGRDGEITPAGWEWTGPAFADLYARCAELLGFSGEARGQRMEALARLSPDPGHSPGDRFWTCGGDAITQQTGWEEAVADRVREAGGVASPRMAPLASALQGSITRLFLEWLRGVRRDTGGQHLRDTGRQHLCLGGTLFYHSSINSAVRLSGLFDDVFVPVDPGVPGLAAGAALLGEQLGPREASAFLGPAFADVAVKATLDNCKLHYGWESEGTAIDLAVDALRAGRLVGWFDGPMESGPRALGARSILASPFSPFVLENLNRYLKRREPWRGYALSGEASAVAEHFDGPARARFMECDFRPRDASAFRHVLPEPRAALRIQTVDEAAPSRFRQLLRAFGERSGVPVLVNTSFNGFQEPLVCSPRDALRVFYGTGLDLLVMGPFVLRK
jgi:carbamoyltransferase